MDFIPAQCAARSLGPANQLVNVLIQTILSSYCAISNPGWPLNCDNPTDGESFDFIVVGGGTAGSVVAGRLSENPNFKVLVLEAGGDPPVESEVPSLLSALQRSVYDWNYYSREENACLGTINKTCYWARGKMLGGSSSINYLIYIRGNKKNYDDWACMGNTDWNYERVLKYFKRWEGNRDPKIANYDHGYYHNQTGPVNVHHFTKYSYAEIYRDAAVQDGIRRICDINADKTLGVLHTQAFIYNGVRQSTAKAYLIPAKNRPNLCIRKHSQVFKILFDENKRAIGVQYNYNGTKNFTVYARKEIILSAGTVESPHLLLLSGIGPKNQLDRFNIPIIRELPVGQTLYDHGVTFIFFKFKGEPPSSTESLDSIFDYLIHRSGDLSGIGSLEIGAFMNTKNRDKWPDVQLCPFYFTQNSSGLSGLLESFGFSLEIQEKMVEINTKYHVGMIAVILLQPKSIGSITLRTSSYTDHPNIKANYFNHPSDRKTIVRGIKRVVSFENTKAFKERKGKLIALPICSEFEYKSDDYWLCYIRYISISGLHAVGTCKMGPKDDSTSVVSPELLVHGVKGLSEADLAVAPYIPSGNTYAATVMIGEKAAAMIANRHSNS